jgi:hypothetical protein
MLSMVEYTKCLRRRALIAGGATATQRVFLTVRRCRLRSGAAEACAVASDLFGCAMPWIVEKSNACELLSAPAKSSGGADLHIGRLGLINAAPTDGRWSLFRLRAHERDYVRWRTNLVSFGQPRNRSVNMWPLRTMAMASAIHSRASW